VTVRPRQLIKKYTNPETAHHRQLCPANNASKIQAAPIAWKYGNTAEFEVVSDRHDRRLDIKVSFLRAPMSLPKIQIAIMIGLDL
jgi:hypothetical protein